MDNRFELGKGLTEEAADLALEHLGQVGSLTITEKGQAPWISVRSPAIVSSGLSSAT